MNNSKVNFPEMPFDFGRKEIDDVLSRLKEWATRTDEIFKNSDKTYKTIKQLEVIDNEISLIVNPIDHLSNVLSSDEKQSLYLELMQKLSEFNSEFYQNEEYAKVINEIAKTNLTVEQEKAIKIYVDSFKANGIGLNDKDKKEIKDINLESINISQKASNNLLKAKEKYELILKDDSDIKDMPESSKLVAKQSDGTYKFTLLQPSFVAFMTYCSNRELREEMYKAYFTQAPENEELLAKLTVLRKRKANILGFETYADYSISKKSAPSKEAVIAFLNDLAQRAKPFAERDFETLKNFAKKLDNLSDLQAYDTSYYADLLKKENGFDENDYLPYFESESTFTRMFSFFERLLGVKFVRKDIKMYDDTVRVFDLEKNGKVIGRLIADMQTRSTKRAGAWMHQWTTYCVDVNGVEHLPVAYINGNFQKATAEQASLLRPDDVSTLFHEMGHALHHLLSTVKDFSVSGTNGVDWDVIEYPSQWLESFFYFGGVLKELGIHYKTGAVISDELIDKLVRNKNFQSGMFLVRQLEFGLFDMTIHLDARTPEEIQNILDDVRKKVAVVTPPRYSKFQNTFSHIMSGSYSAGYYSYLWAEVLSADTFNRQVPNANGTIKDIDYKDVERFVDMILSKGGSDSMSNMFKAYAGRDVDPSGLLRSYGLV